MHRARREEFIHQEVRKAAEFYRETNLKATRLQAFLGVWTQISLYSLIGLLLFLLPSFEAIPPETLTGYIVAILYVMGPISSILGTAPTLERGQVALENIERLGISLNDGPDDGQLTTWSISHLNPLRSCNGTMLCFLTEWEMESIAPSLSAPSV